MSKNQFCWFLFALPLLSLLLSAPPSPAVASPTSSPYGASHGGIVARELLQQRNFVADEAALASPLFSGAGQRLADMVAWQQEQVQQRLRKQQIMNAIKKKTGNSGSSSPSKQDTPTPDTDGSVVTPTSATEDSSDCPYTSAGSGQNLHKCAMGYAAVVGVTGGAGKTCGGRYPSGYVVTTEEDVSIGWSEGSLRWAMKYCTDGVFITFAKSMKITLVLPLYVPADTTIDGRGHQIVITGGALMVYWVSNVIIHNIEVGNIPGDTDITHIRNTTRVWVDHVRVYNAARGTISVVYGSTDVTVSNSYLQNGNFMQLLGAADDAYYDRNLRVTLYRNWYDKSGQRQPHCRWGKCHVANSLYTGWTYYCLGARVYGRVRSERNYFIGGPRKEVTPWFNDALQTPGFDNTGTIRSYGDRLENGSTIHEFLGTVAAFNPPYKLVLMEPTDDMKDFITQNAGPHFPASEALPP